MERKKSKIKKILYLGLPISFILGAIIYFILRDITISMLVLSIPIIIGVFVYFKDYLVKIDRIKKIEVIFPDFLQLMASNLRAGMSTDKALFLSARKEFSPLDEEVQKVAKSVTIGKTLEFSLIEMSKRIGSKRIEKVIFLINSGLRSGGNLATLLEETSSDMREKEFVEKRAVSNINMYIIFIFMAAAIGSPALFALSTLLVDILTKILSDLPAIESTSASIPMAFTKIDISTTFIRYFSIVFIIATDLFASLILGLISKGEEKQGLKYFIPLTLIGLSVFFLARFLLSGFILGLF